MPRLSSGPIIFALLLLSAGCSIEKPQAPSFDTVINIPTGTYLYTVADLIRRNEMVEGDTTGRNPVRVAWRGRIDSIDVADRLEVDLPGRIVSASLGEISIPPPPPVGHTFFLRDFIPFQIPGDSVSVVLPAFDFLPVEGDVPPLAGFEDGILANGRLTLTIRNGLPVAVEKIRCELLNADDGGPIAAIDLIGPIPPGGEDVAGASLAGARIRNRLRARLASGSTLASDGAVEVSGSDSLTVMAAFTDLSFESVTCAIDRTTIVAADSVSIGSSVHVTDGRIGSGTLPITLANTIPLPVTVEVRLPDVRLGGLEWARSYDIAAGSPGAPALLHADIDLSGADLVPAYGGDGGEYFHHLLRIETEGSGGESIHFERTMGAALDAAPLHLSFDSVTGAFEPLDASMTATRTAFELPPGTEGITFTEATLRLTVENGLQIPARLDLLATGVHGADSTSLPLTGTILPATDQGPVETELTWSEANSDIVSLINLHPEEIIVTGSVGIGDGVTVGTVHREDALTGGYEITAPLRVRISPTEMRPDSFTFRINKDLQDRIRQDVHDGEAALALENHLPIGGSVSLVFAGSPGDLRSAPDVVLGPVRIDAAECDPLTGRVVHSRTTPATIALANDQIRFFARDEVYGQAIVTLGSGGSGTVELLSDDYIKVSGLLRLRMEVHE